MYNPSAPPLSSSSLNVDIVTIPSDCTLQYHPYHHVPQQVPISQSFYNPPVTQSQPQALMCYPPPPYQYVPTSYRDPNRVEENTTIYIDGSDCSIEEERRKIELVRNRRCFGCCFLSGILLLLGFFWFVLFLQKKL